MAVLKLSPRFAAGLVLLACIVASARGADVTLAPRSIANQSGAAVETGGTRWIGTGANATASRLGIVFAVSALPTTALRSATLQITSAWTQWITVDAQIAAELSDNPRDFGPRAPPSERPVSAEIAHYAENSRWGGSGVFGIDVTAPVQALLSRYPNPAGIALIARGQGTAWGRKFFGASGGTPRLRLTFEDPPAPPPAPAPVAASGATPGL
jgi:hypothetical protein